MARTSTIALLAVLAMAACLSGANSQAAKASPKAAAKAAPAAKATSVEVAIALFQATNVTVDNATIFAPTDRAFKKLAEALNITTEAEEGNTTMTMTAPGSNTTSTLVSAFLSPALANVSLEVLSLHVVPGAVLRAADIPEGNTSVPTLAGLNITVHKTPQGEVHVYGPGNTAAGNRGLVLAADIPFGTNLVHIIEDVLIPTGLPNNGTDLEETPESEQQEVEAGEHGPEEPATTTPTPTTTTPAPTATTPDTTGAAGATGTETGATGPTGTAGTAPTTTGATGTAGTP